MSYNPEAWFPLRYHKGQSDAWRTRKKYVALACGRGSGKTEIACRRIVRYLAVKKPWPDPRYFYALPTYNQASRVAWEPLRKLVPDEWVKKTSESEMSITTVFGSKLYVVGLDKPQRIEGVQWDGCVIDESCDQKPGVFDRSVQPSLSHRDAWCWRIGVPKRYGTGAREFKAYFDKGTDGNSGVFAATWPSWEILTSEQIAWAKENLDEKDFDEQYGATWGTAGGQIFFAFDDALNVTPQEYDPSRPLVIGSDFNVDPMAWVICQLSSDTQTIRVLDEIYIRDTYTTATLDALYGKYKEHTAGFWFFGDASSRARNTRATTSDYLHILNDDRFTPKKVLYPKANPARADRFSACNTRFCNVNGARRVAIDPKCSNLRRDLIARSYIEGTREPNDSPDIGHISDAIGYVLYALWPPTHVISTKQSVYSGVLSR